MFSYHCLVVDLDDFVTGMYPGALVGRALESDVSYHVVSLIRLSHNAEATNLRIRNLRLEDAGIDGILYNVRN